MIEKSSPVNRARQYQHGIAPSLPSHCQCKRSERVEIHVEILPIAEVGAVVVEDEHTDELGEAVQRDVFEASTPEDIRKA